MDAGKTSGSIERRHDNSSHKFVAHPLKELANTNRLFSWYSKYFGNIKRKVNLSDEEKRDYLQGLIDKIYVKYDAVTNTHDLKLCFRHPIIGDIYERLDENDKDSEYNIHEGTREIVVALAKNDGKTSTYAKNNSKKKTIKQLVTKRNAPQQNHSVTVE